MIRITLRVLLLVTLLYIPKSSSAAERTPEQKREAAVKVLCNNTDPKFRRLKGKDREVKQLFADSLMTVMGSPGGGFAVIANDDVFEAVIGYSDAPFDAAAAEKNLNFRWWRESIAKIMAATRNGKAKAPSRVVAPGEGVEKNVAPLLSTTWAQDTPYNNLCPTDGDKHVLVGCVATSMAQVLYYNQHPTKGEGQRTIYYPYNNSESGTAYTVDFGVAVYDYANMLDDYSKDYTEEQAHAAAVLNYHCGVASDMQYGLNASGTTMYACRDGLIKYLGYANATLYERSRYGEEEWMKLVFEEISGEHPIIYAGTDMTSGFGGHCFVLDGYDANGLVHVNWGWAGSFNGYYNIAYLNPSNYAFTENQQMVLGVYEDKTAAIEKTADVATPGTLASLVGEENKYNVSKLTVSGKINSTDLRTIREMAGRTASGSRTHGRLKYVDMKKAEIVAGGENFFGSLTTKDGELPSRAFFDCQTLSYVALPENTTSIGEAAFANAISLDSAYVPTSGKRDYVYIDGVVYTSDTTRCLTTMPFVSGKLVMAPALSEITNYGMAGCVGLSKVEFPAGLKKLGDYAMAGNSFLSEIKVRAKKAPTAGTFAFNGIIRNTCSIYVPAGYKENYDGASQWRLFKTNNYDNIKMFGSFVTVRNLTRQYGEENPQFTYIVTGDGLRGKPEFKCEATPTSKIGRYPVTILRGTVEGDDVEFEDGYLVVSRAPLKLIAKDCTREAGKANPEFEYTCEGLKNNETPEEAITKQPTFTCEATPDSPEGQYEIGLGGAKATNYSLKYVAGTLTVTEATGITDVANGGQ